MYYVTDTTGFSSFELELMEPIPKEERVELFPDFRPYLGLCRFLNYAKLKEPDCAVLSTLVAGEIMASRHQSYLKLYESVEQFKPWENNEPGWM